MTTTKKPDMEGANLSQLGSPNADVQYVWEDIPKDSPLAVEFTQIQHARTTVIDESDTCDKGSCEDDSFTRTTWRPVNIRKRTGEVISCNELDPKTLEQVRATRFKVALCLSHVQKQLEKTNK